ncbi:sirohydrochlorin chelatase [Piscinibacter sp.]|uniref:sirohydrochlorin chelatase n=1 Tax=Piscinibacter sp. TaxID=1903157 RepID=UPI002C870FB0|nr:CbiX/SirB N-terminal domain-containing protein [Albitalea sp.]HUG22863.1 CbiX/SirB N-terminal domain-containing protein [Albitalea sp.]
MRRGLLLFAHGARDSRWALPFEEITKNVRDHASGVPVELGFLEFMSPDLVEGGSRLAAAGCTRVDVVPLFLGAGGHVRRDVPELLARLELAHPQVHWVLRPTIGEVDSVVEAMAVASLAWLERE